MVLTRDEKALVLLWRIEDIKRKTLFGYYPSYKTGENKIKKLKRKLENMGYNPDAEISIQ